MFRWPFTTLRGSLAGLSRTNTPRKVGAPGTPLATERRPGRVLRSSESREEQLLDWRDDAMRDEEHAR